MIAIADGTVETRADGTTVIRFERRFSHPVERVWEAITDYDQVIRWWGDLDVELVPGGRFVLRWLNEGDQGESSAWKGKITEIEPGRVLETTGVWGAPSAWDEAPECTLRFELVADGDETVLRFTNVVPLPDEFKTKTPAGWHWHLDVLADVLDGGPVRDIVNVEGWEPIHEAYEEKLAAR
jgi:uncharacterized protein YndB with AHSA1/START domain